MTTAPAAAAPGPAAAPAAGAAPAAPAAGAAQEKPAAPAASVWDGLQDAGNRDYAKTKNWATHDDAVKSYREAESRLGTAIVKPADNAPQAEWDAYYGKLGRPATPGEYKYQRPAGVPADFPYQESEMLALNEVAHKAGLTPQQAAAIHDGIVTRAAAQHAAEREAEGTAIEAAHTELVKEWGDPTGETYQRNVELSNRAIRNLGGEPLKAELVKLGALGRDGEVKSPIIAKLLAQAGKGMFGEDTLFEGPNVTNNPFAAGEHENITEQGRIVKADPARAKQLIIAAGKDPKAYSL